MLIPSLLLPIHIFAPDCLYSACSCLHPPQTFGTGLGHLLRMRAIAWRGVTFVTASSYVDSPRKRLLKLKLGMVKIRYTARCICWAIFPRLNGAMPFLILLLRTSAVSLFPSCMNTYCADVFYLQGGAGCTAHSCGYLAGTYVCTTGSTGGSAASDALVRRNVEPQQHMCLRPATAFHTAALSTP